MDEIEETIRIVGGSPTAEELATVIAVLQAAHSQERAEVIKNVVERKSSWSRNDAKLRGSIIPGRGQWRAAYRSGLN